MDAHLAFWTLALAHMALLVAVAARGVRLARRGRYRAHARAMRLAAVLVAVFLVAYAAKRSVLGPEDLDRWSRGALLNLWVHEAFVTVMLVAGVVGLVRGRRLARSRLVTGRPQDPQPEEAARRRHRRAGWTAVAAAVAGLLTAVGILVGMLVRAAP
jgi:uncharacterized membrane protein YozB (DUF420 family)